VTAVSVAETQVRKTADLLKSPATAVWLFLIAATAVQWALGTDHALIDDTTATSLILLVVAFVKVRFIGLYFMELKNAPLTLRMIFEGWCLIVCGLSIGFYLTA
jgi:Prokaryotic Cytochrome C oxidase subunit IV